jgi:phage gp45-like
MLRKLKQIIRQAVISFLTDDTEAYPIFQVTSNQKATDVIRLSTYGIFGMPPLDSHVVLFSSQGQEAVKFGIANDFLRRKKGLKEGECGLLNTLTGTFIFLREDGKIEINADIISSGEIEASDFDNGAVKFNTHIHPGVTTGVNNTGTPI